ncbi:hypothetical protein EXS54_02480 [Patescibacteria group bacterium]|nr:hypothetical protein [Patescibacteria group bacterium]
MKHSLGTALHWLNQHRLRVGVAVILAIGIVASVSILAAEPSNGKDFVYIEKPKPNVKVNPKFPITVTAKPKKGRDSFTVRVKIDNRTVITRTKKFSKPSDGKKKITYKFKNATHPAESQGQHQITTTMLVSGNQVAQAGGYSFTVTNKVAQQPDDSGDEETEEDESTDKPEESSPTAQPEQPATQPNPAQNPIAVPAVPDTDTSDDAADTTNPTTVIVQPSEPDKETTDDSNADEATPTDNPENNDDTVLAEDEDNPVSTTEDSGTSDSGSGSGDGSSSGSQSGSSLSGSGSGDTGSSGILPGISPSPSAGADVAGSASQIPVWQQLLLALLIFGGIGGLAYFGIRYYKNQQV